jgi:hypothetical protein
MCGRCTIGARSGLRKLMRAARRNRIPDDRFAVIDWAEQSAARRGSVYLNSYARRLAEFRRGLGIVA